MKLADIAKALVDVKTSYHPALFVTVTIAGVCVEDELASDPREGRNAKRWWVRQVIKTLKKAGLSDD